MNEKNSFCFRMDWFITDEEIRAEVERLNAEDLWSDDEDDNRRPVERDESTLLQEICSDDEDNLLENDDNQDDEFEVLVEDEVPQPDLHSDTGDRNFILGKDEETIWTDTPLLPNRSSRVPARNLITHLPGAKGTARTAENELDFFMLFITNEMAEKIVLHTNVKIAEMAENYTTPQSFTVPTNERELKALFGLLFFSGVLRKSNLKLDDLYSRKYGPPIFRAVMSKQRLEFLLSSLRFDSITTRVERNKTDKFAAFREIWDEFCDHCQKNYTPSEYLTIDETLLSFRGRCGFRMYIPNKPDKYGLKVISLCDARTFYFMGGIPYVGKGTITQEPGMQIPTQYVLSLTENVKNTNRNITVDNWFCSYQLAEKLKEHKLTLVGTLRKNKKEIPPSFISTKGIPLNTSRFLYQPDKIIVAFNQKPRKNVILLSTMHDDGEINVASKKPEIVSSIICQKGVLMFLTISVILTLLNERQEGGQ